MGALRWFEVDRPRVVLEHTRMCQAFPGFVLGLDDGRLAWEGEIDECPPGVEATPLRVRLVYPPAYPIRPPRIMPLGPALPEEHWGHEWHRHHDGGICIVEPARWEPAFTAVEALVKASDWYFNYLAHTHGLIAAMPDVGRAILASNGDGTR